MSGVKRYLVTRGSEVSEMVYASDYDRDTQALEDELDNIKRSWGLLHSERDALRAQVEVMRAALCKFTSLGIVSCNWDEMDDALRHANAALQEPNP